MVTPCALLWATGEALNFHLPDISDGSFCPMPSLVFLCRKLAENQSFSKEQQVVTDCCWMRMHEVKHDDTSAEKLHATLVGWCDPLSLRLSACVCFSLSKAALNHCAVQMLRALLRGIVQSSLERSDGFVATLEQLHKLVPHAVFLFRHIFSSCAFQEPRDLQ